MTDHTLLIVFIILGAVWLFGSGRYFYGNRPGYTRPAYAPYSIVGVVVFLVIVYIALRALNAV